VNSVMNLRVPKNAGKLSSGFRTGDLLSSAQLHRDGGICIKKNLIFCTLQRILLG
jgi:hypothetical protein